MKYLATLCVAVLAVGVNSVAIPEPEAAAVAGPVDDKLKLEAEAVCWLPGQPWGKVKCAAEAIASALAEAHTKREANPEAKAICWLPGQPCGKAKRSAEALAEAAAVAVASLGSQGNKLVLRKKDHPTHPTHSHKTTATTTTAAPPTSTDDDDYVSPTPSQGYCGYGCARCYKDETLVVQWCEPRSRGTCYDYLQCYRDGEYPPY